MLVSVGTYCVNVVVFVYVGECGYLLWPCGGVCLCW